MTTGKTIASGGRYSKMNSLCVQLGLKLLRNVSKVVINCMYSVSHVCLFATSWTVAHQALLSVGFSKQEYWSGLPFPPPGDLPDPRIEPESPVLAVDSLLLSHQGSPESVSGRCEKQMVLSQCSVGAGVPPWPLQSSENPTSWAIHVPKGPCGMWLHLEVKD